MFFGLVYSRPKKKNNPNIKAAMKKHTEIPAYEKHIFTISKRDNIYCVCM